MSRSQSTFLMKHTLTAVFSNGLFSAITVILVFRHLAMVPLSGGPILIADSILQSFIATLMSIMPPSLMTAKWMLTKPALTTAKTPAAGIWIALFTALAGNPLCSRRSSAWTPSQ